MWHKLADRLNMPVGELQASVSSTEFLRWCKYFEREWEERTRDHWYLAQIAYEIWVLRLAWTGGDPSKRTTKDFLINFGTESKPKPAVPKTRPANSPDKNAAAVKSKQVWLMFAGLQKDGTRPAAPVRTKAPPKTRGQQP